MPRRQPAKKEKKRQPAVGPKPGRTKRSPKAQAAPSLAIEFRREGSDWQLWRSYASEALRDAALQMLRDYHQDKKFRKQPAANSR